MELSFIINALRRYFWLPLIGALIGLVIPSLLLEDNVEEYESTAVLLVSPPSESALRVSFSGDPDRFVIGQLSVLQAEGTAERVAAQVGLGLDTDSVAAATVITQVPRTEIVQITVTTADPSLSQSIADTYIDVYLTILRSQVAGSQQPDLERIDAELEQIKSDIEDIDTLIQAVMVNFLPSGEPLPEGQTFPPIPDLAQVAPNLASQREILLAEFDQTLTTRTRYELNAQLLVTSQVIQGGNLPDEPLPRSDGYLVVAGGVAGLGLGVVLALLLARISPRVLSRPHAEQLLRHAFVAEIPRERSFGRDRRAALEALPANLVPSIDALCVRAEANAKAGEPLTVVVVGTERSAGSTTLAMAMANRYAAMGSQTLLIDGDARDPELTHLFASGSPGLAGLLALTTGRLASSTKPGAGLDPFSQSGVPGLSVVGVGAKSDATVLRRQNVPDIIAKAVGFAHVVVFDGGPLLDSASTMQLASMVDVVVVSVPLRRQASATLDVVGRQLATGGAAVLPVESHPTHRRRQRPLNDQFLDDTNQPPATRTRRSSGTSAADRDTTAAR